MADQVKPFRIFAGLFWLAATACLVASPFLYFKAKAFVSTAVSTPGTVVQNLDKDDSFYPIVKFTDAQGTVRTETMEAGRSPAAYEPGAAVTVLYPPGEPGKARIDNFSSVWLMPVAFLVSAGCGYVGGAIAWCVPAWIERRGRVGRTVSPV